LAIIIDNDRGQRVGLVDLRIAGNSIVIRPNTEEIFSVQIDNMELVPGRYSVKVWASGDGIYKDIEMGDLEVLEQRNINMLSVYPNNMNGIIAFKGNATRRTVCNLA